MHETVLLIFFDDYSAIASEVKYKTINGERIKTLAPKQVLQRLPIALAQVKAANIFKSLLNEIRQIIYFLYQTNEITKKEYNSITKSVQL